MKIHDIRLLRGPNYWSNRRHKLVEMVLDLEEMESLPSDKINGFAERIETLLPGLYEHHCSVGRPGGFLERVKAGTWMGHIVEHVALEIQTLAGMECNFGQTRGTGQEGVYSVVFSYTEEFAGLYAAEAAVRIVEALISGAAYDLDTDIAELKWLHEKYKLGPSTQSIVDEALKRDIPVMRLNASSLIQLGHGVNQKRIRATMTGDTGSLGVELACNKKDTKLLLQKAGIPVPYGATCSDEEELKYELLSVGYPCVIKPIDGNHGRGATIGIHTEAEAIQAFHLAQSYSEHVIVERLIKGHDFRLLVINYQLVAAARRSPAHVVGDGYSTIAQLIAAVNANPERGCGHGHMLTQISVDEMTLQILNAKNLQLNAVLPLGEMLPLKNTANLSTGGTATDVTDAVHPENVLMAERIARIIGLDICGIDVMATQLSLPLPQIGGAVIEVNAAPGFRMHLRPTEGLSRNVAAPVIDMLYPPGREATIPIVAVTGTNGKTTTTRLIAHIMGHAGYKVGFTTSEGIQVQGSFLQKGDCTGPKSARFVLSDPTVNFAVLETARGGILREGLGFSSCDIGIVMNITSDHLGMKGIHSLEDMARVKSVVVENVSASGYSILNADDPYVLSMMSRIRSKVALFSLNGQNEALMAHCKSGGTAAFCENGMVTINDGGRIRRIAHVDNIPLTFSGRAVFMVQNVLAAALTAFLRKVDMKALRLALRAFIPSPTMTPGRMNLFHFKDFDVLLDYAHNPAGMATLGIFLEKVDGFPKIGVASGTGDRRDEDIIELGKGYARSFDELIIRPDADLRGRSAEAIYSLLLEGIRSVDASMPVAYEPDEKAAITKAIKGARPGAFITVICDSVPRSIGYITELQQEEGVRALMRENAQDMEV